MKDNMQISVLHFISTAINNSSLVNCPGAVKCEIGNSDYMQLQTKIAGANHDHI